MNDKITTIKEDFRRIGYEVIPRAQYEALIEAAKALKMVDQAIIELDPLNSVKIGMISNAIVDLSAAGIDPFGDSK